MEAITSCLGLGNANFTPEGTEGDVNVNAIVSTVDSYMWLELESQLMTRSMFDVLIV